VLRMRSCLPVSGGASAGVDGRRTVRLGWPDDAPGRVADFLLPAVLARLVSGLKLLEEPVQVPPWGEYGRAVRGGSMPGETVRAELVVPGWQPVQQVPVVADAPAATSLPAEGHTAGEPMPPLPVGGPAVVHLTYRNHPVACCGMMSEWLSGMRMAGSRAGVKFGASHPSSSTTSPMVPAAVFPSTDPALFVSVTLTSCGTVLRNSPPNTRTLSPNSVTRRRELGPYVSRSGRVFPFA